MKFLCLVTFALWAIAQGANLQNEILAPGISVSNWLGQRQYEVLMRSRDFEETQDILLSEEDTKDVQNLNESRIVTGAIEEILEQVRDVIINGNDDIPPLDPLVVPVLGPFEYRETGVAAEATINNLRMEGLRWFVADRINVNALRLTFGITLTVPWITITGSYDARARVALISHRAGGDFRIFAHRVEFGFDMRMGTNILGGGHLVLRELKIHIDIHDTHVSITGMTGSTLINSFISAAIQNVSQEVIQSQLENVSRILSEELFDAINDVLKNYTVNDIFG